MTDLFSTVEVGEAVKTEAQMSFKAQASITKGQSVKMSTHTAGEIGSITVAGAGDKAIGVALKSASAGEYVPVLLQGIVKVTGSGAITIGAAVKSGASGVVAAAVRTMTIPSGETTVTSSSAQPSMTVEAGVAFGFALQTFADGDTGLIYVGAVA
jgi:hypothetical protein